MIAGCMFSGKTEELIRRLRRAVIARQKVQVFKPSLDDRYAEGKVSSHDGLQWDAISVTSAESIPTLIEADTQVVAIDEVQFFDDNIVAICDKLANNGKRVIVAGLDQDFSGKPFGPMPALLAIAEYVAKLNAICVKCGNPASRTQRLTKSKETVVVGTTDIYEARCRNCHEVL